MGDAPFQSTHAVTHFACQEPRVRGAVIELPSAALAGDTVVAEFTEVIELPAALDDAAAELVAPTLRLLALAVSLSYFKAFAPTRYVVPSGLTPTERTFITELLRNGLGEFAFVNSLPEVFDTEIVAAERPEPSGPGTPSGSRPDPAGEPRRALVAVGGGKDSIVSIEALAGAGYEVGLFAVNPKTPMVRTAEVADQPLVSVRRAIDPALLALNAAGAPNGHVPVTAINSLIATLTALALGYDAVVFSNEAGSSYGNFAWSGRVINHQWSKGSEFEGLLRASLPAGAPQYLSLLRPLNEIRIARRFASYAQYHGVFTSCNRAYRMAADGSAGWCGECPKCHFIFLMLAPFLTRQALLDIFSGRDLFADEAQYQGFLELFGTDGLVKPFECVGEPDECRVALSLLRDHDDWQGHPFLAKPEIAALDATAAEREAVFAWRDEAHFLTPKLEGVVRAI
ncbi:hypothetical protein [Leucobacter chromiireducens]|uniref:hypothetical protein n=1 Tax=Leucobacter chromiireducens TaxID=283877 RepID=UPI001F484E69|nr:hypothetical protein [Leucobacter chromiireducens]